MYIKRKLENTVIKASKNFPVVLVTGPRQVGKTTMLKRLADNNRKYVTLDDMILRDLAKNDPQLFLERYAPPVLIDEVQYAPELLPYIKMRVDESKEKGDYWLTGSQMFYLMQNVTESLAGRVAVINMLGLSNSEIKGNDFDAFKPNTDELIKRAKSADKQSLHEVFKRIHKGSMPALYESDNDIEMYYSSYVTTYLERDIRDLIQVGDLSSFLRFLTCCAARTSKMLNYAEIAKDVGITAPTAKTWMSLLISSGIITLVEPYHNNALKRIIKAPNIYFLDTGLCAYLTRWTNPEALEVSAMSGAFFETYVVSEIIKSYLNVGRKPPIYYYRDSDKKEIDLIIEENGILYPIEIKKSSNPKRDAIRHFKVLKNKGLEVGEGAVISLVNDVIPIDKDNNMVPVWLV